MSCTFHVRDPADSAAAVCGAEMRVTEQDYQGRRHQEACPDCLAAWAAAKLANEDGIRSGGHLDRSRWWLAVVAEELGLA